MEGLHDLQGLKVLKVDDQPTYVNTACTAYITLFQGFSTFVKNRISVSKYGCQEVQDFTMSGDATLSILLLKSRRFSPALIGGLRGQPDTTDRRLCHDRVSGSEICQKYVSALVFKTWF